MKDTNPLTTPNNILTDCLNGTTITYNGKEFVLQNDMGNAIVETASLKRGYIPIGLKEYNGIIYVVSYNPLEDRVEFGSFPSPERDFSGDDFENDDFTLEGCVLADSDFYTPNSKHPQIIQLTQVEEDPNVALGDAPVIIQEETVSVDQPITSTAFVPYSSEYVDNPTGLGIPYLGIVGIEDFWKLNTQIGQPKFNISKASITDDFSSYEKLKLNTGDRFVLYYIDRTEVNNTNPQDYIKNVFLPYVSYQRTKNLFKVEVFALTKSGRKKLDVDPFLYTKEDTTDFLNGSTTENIQYNVYDFDNEGTIEIRISLEKPEYFSVKFSQYPQITPTVKFSTLQSSSSFMQIKGYKYIFKYLSTPSPLQKGYMYYKADHLYTSTTEGFVKNSKQQGTVVLTDLQYGTYSYEILPFTQYGYEYDLIKKGTFEVSEDLTLQENPVVLNEFWWNYIPGGGDTWQLHFDTNITLDVTQEITSQYLELYDVWSNCSHVIDLLVPPVVPGDPYDPNVVFDNVFKLDGPDKTKTHVKSSTGQIYGMPYSSLKQSVLTKLPTTDIIGNVNYENRVECIDPITLTDISLRKNHLYIFAVYYTYYDSLFEQSLTKGLYRYVYTNDAFQDLYNQGHVDFSIVGSYPLQTISLSLDNAASTLTQSHNLEIDGQADNLTLLFDPMQQTYNNITKSPNDRVLTGYAIGPEDYFSNLSSNDYTVIHGVMTNTFTKVCSYNYNIASNAPGYIDTNIISVSHAPTTPIVQSGIRTALDSGNIAFPVANPTEVFGNQANQNYTVSAVKYDTKLMIGQTSNPFEVQTNKIFPYYDELINGAALNYFYPLFYQQSREVQNKIANDNANPTIDISAVNIQMQHSITNPIAISHYMSIDNHNINMNLYSSNTVNQLTYGLLDMRAFWNDMPGKLGIHKSNTTTGMSATIQTKFLDATKSINNQPALAQLWNIRRSANSGTEWRQYIPIVNYFNPGTSRIREALEVPFDYNAANVFLFFGSKVNVNDYNYYKYYVEPTHYYYEQEDSTLVYNLNHNSYQNFASDYCYKIIMGAKGKIISLQEEGTDENLRLYITSKFPFQDYSNTDFFPKCLNLAAQTLPMFENIIVRPNEDNIMQNQSDARLNTNSNNHPIYNPTGFIFDGTADANFISSNYKEDTPRLYNLMVNDGTTTSNKVTALMLQEGPNTVLDTTTYTTVYDGISNLLLNTYKLD